MPAAHERSRAQRDRILQAAQQCFISSGFHAASMASIAQTADMSAGLIYRYFDGKSAIILAIIERQLAERRTNIATLRSAPELSLRVIELFRAWRSGDPKVMNAALFLEMSAEASRDPQVAAALRHSDQVSSEDFLAWMRQLALAQGRAPHERELLIRALALQAFIEGLAIRAVREPQFDEAVLQATVEAMVPPLLDFTASPAPVID